MTGRDDRGRFARGNAEARRGGQARAQALTPERRREIARAGWLAVVTKRFGGDAEAAAAYLDSLGA
jgi:general stress protein YciG